MTTSDVAGFDILWIAQTYVEEQAGYRRRFSLLFSIYVFAWLNTFDSEFDLSWIDLNWYDLFRNIFF